MTTSLYLTYFRARSAMHPDAGCDHITNGTQAWTCLCCPGLWRCEPCHRDHLPGRPCPVCNAPLDLEIRHEITDTVDQPRPIRPTTTRDEILPGSLVVHAQVCGSCAIDNDLANL